jgi:hypothetical protein
MAESKSKAKAKTAETKTADEPEVTPEVAPEPEPFPPAEPAEVVPVPHYDTGRIDLGIDLPAYEPEEGQEPVVSPSMEEFLDARS